MGGLPGFQSVLDPEGRGKTLERKRNAVRELLSRCRKDPNVFTEYVLGYVQADIHKTIQEAFNNHERLVIMIPREHGKTSQVMSRIAWEIGKNPEIRIKVVSESTDLAESLVPPIEKILRSVRYRQVFPNVTLGKASKTRLTAKRKGIFKDPTLEPLGILSSSTGKRADLIVADDPVGFKTVIAQPSMMGTVKKSFYSNIINFATRRSRIWYICTAWHENDLTHDYIKKPGVHTIVKAIPRSMESLWEDNWPKDRLEQRRGEIGDREFDRNFRNQPLSESDTLFKAKDVDRMVVNSRFERDNSNYCVTAVDLAVSLRKSADYTVIFTVEADKNGNRRILDIDRGRWTAPETSRRVNSAYMKFNSNIVIVENNAFQGAMIQWLADSGYNIPVKGHQTGSNKVDLSIGLPSLALEIENGKWLLPYAKKHGTDCRCAQCAFLAELKSYPVAKHDDTVMAAWMAMVAIRERHSGSRKIRLWRFGNKQWKEA